MQRKQSEDHVLLQSRLIAAVGLISVGGGIGLALMLARVLVPVGFAIAIASELCVFWLYARYLRSAYRAVTKRIPYRGPRMLELVFANVLAILLIGVSIAVFSIVISREPASGRATLEFSSIQRTKLPADAANGILNVQIKNSGSLNAEQVQILVAGHVRRAEIPASDLKDELAALEASTFQLEREGRAIAYRPQILPGNAALISLQDFDFKQWPDFLANKNAFPPAIQISDQEWRDFEQGTSLIYVLYVVHYEDEGHPKSYWTGSNCLYFAVTTSFWHNCGSNRIDLIGSPRHQ